MGLILIVANFFYWYGIVCGQVVGEAAVQQMCIGM